jgi:hypothetical protein
MEKYRQKLPMADSARAAMILTSIPTGWLQAFISSSASPISSSFSISLSNIDTDAGVGAYIQGKGLLFIKAFYGAGNLVFIPKGRRKALLCCRQMQGIQQEYLIISSFLFGRDNVAIPEEDTLFSCLVGNRCLYFSHLAFCLSVLHLCEGSFWL